MFDVDAFLGYLTNAYLLEGVAITVVLTVITILIGFVLGVFIAVAHMSHVTAISAPARFYSWFFRGTPLLVQLVIIYTGLPQVGIRFGVTMSAVLALSLNESAYISETVRAGFKAIPRGQGEAAQALGLSSWQRLRLVLLPQAIRIIIPPIGNSVNGLLKATSLASVISVEELMRRSQVLMEANFQVLELYCVAAVYYLLLTTLWSLVQARLERRFGRGFADASRMT